MEDVCVRARKGFKVVAIYVYEMLLKILLHTKWPHAVQTKKSHVCPCCCAFKSTKPRGQERLRDRMGFVVQTDIWPLLVEDRQKNKPEVVELMRRACCAHRQSRIFRHLSLKERSPRRAARRARERKKRNRARAVVGWQAAQRAGGRLFRTRVVASLPAPKRAAAGLMEAQEKKGRRERWRTPPSIAKAPRRRGALRAGARGKGCARGESGERACSCLPGRTTKTNRKEKKSLRADGKKSRRGNPHLVAEAGAWRGGRGRGRNGERARRCEGGGRARGVVVEGGGEGVLHTRRLCKGETAITEGQGCAGLPRVDALWQACGVPRARTLREHARKRRIWPGCGEGWVSWVRGGDGVGKKGFEGSNRQGRERGASARRPPGLLRSRGMLRGAGRG